MPAQACRSQRQAHVDRCPPADPTLAARQAQHAATRTYRYIKLALADCTEAQLKLAERAIKERRQELTRGR